MKKLIPAIIAASLMSLTFSMAAEAHVVPWRAGDVRMKGVGHCAKGPCMKRVDWSVSKPHRHAVGGVKTNRVAPLRRYAHVHNAKCARSHWRQ